jgi:epsin
MNISSFDIKEKFKSVKNVVMQVTPVEAKVRACTSNDPWGAKSTDKSEVAEATYNL